VERGVSDTTNNVVRVLLVDRHRPGVVLMDVRMERLDGVAATRLLQAQRPRRPASC
jgi:DNA-binding NarL/FixJ family response regulator